MIVCTVNLNASLHGSVSSEPLAWHLDATWTSSIEFAIWVHVHVHVHVRVARIRKIAPSRRRTHVHERTTTWCGHVHARPVLSCYTNRGRTSRPRAWCARQSTRSGRARDLRPDVSAKQTIGTPYHVYVRTPKTDVRGPGLESTQNAYGSSGLALLECIIFRYRCFSTLALVQHQ